MVRTPRDSFLCLLCTGACLVQGKEFCFGENREPYRCEMGYCCGETECCTYYHELWWFWLVWTVIILLSCCCAYRHRRLKLRLQHEQRQREISLMAYQGASSTSTPLAPITLRLWSSFKLPAYDEVAGHPPTPPPPYSPEQDADPAVMLVTSLTQQQQHHEEEWEGAEPGTLHRDTPAEGGARAGTSHGRENCLSRSSVRVESTPQGEGEGEESSDTGRRRRHMTGDSGIEVCACRGDGDPCLEEDAGGEGRLCQGMAGECCEASSLNTKQQQRDRASSQQDTRPGEPEQNGL
ncbi:WW domain-binding protein 1 [Polyodon spathula]|uniref:WW domain-binding protein 1 n=1 Tax=Polyodon spathula TaxID=7913 RepID=UPI001B7F17A5|nr:WW domain-binding protein 1 [Polyodon spathula]